MQDAIYNTISWAQNLANKPYVPYEQQRIAGFTPTEQAGMRAAVEASGAYQPYLTQAGGTLGQAAGISGAGAAAGALGQAAGMSGAGAAQPYFQQGLTPIQMAGQGRATEAAQPFLGQAIEGSPLSTAQPYFQQAAQTFPGAVSQYMSPYTEGVVNRIADLGARNLREKFLPEIGEEFIRAGQFGGSRMGEFGARALRDVQESVLGEQAKALQAGYGQAADIFASDVGRQAQLAGTAGQLGTAQQRALLEAGSTMGQFSTSDLQRMLSSGVNIADIGKSFGTLTGQDASRLADIGQMRGVISAQDAANLRAIAQQQGVLGEAAQNLGLRGAAAVTGVGQAERGMAQRALDQAYEQYLEERRYPYEQLQFQAGIVGGFPSGAAGTTQTRTDVSTPAEPSGLAKILALLSGGKGVLETLKED